MSALEFVISEGGSKSRTIAFPSASFVIGSDAGCDVRLDPKLVRPRHAEVETDENGFIWVIDLTGMAQTSVDGQAVRRAELHVGTFLKLGQCELMVRAAGRHTGPSGTMATPTPLRQLGTRRSVEATDEQPVDQTRLRPSGRGDASPLSDTSVREQAVLVSGVVIDNRYKVIRKVAAGGMGEVYEVEHVELGKQMALKLMLPELSSDPEFVARFKREAISASRIGQQNIVDISDFGQTPDKRFYFVMEYLEGMTLASLVHREGAQPLVRGLNIMLQVSRALAAAHSKGIVHRDLKPENIMLLQRPGQPDFVKVLDFGIAKVSDGRGKGGQTAVGMVVGTPQYMSPEQAMAVPVDYRSDIYSLGLIFYELITGRPTFEGETPSMLMVKQCTAEPPPFAPGPVNSVPNELQSLVFAMLAKAPADRPQAMEKVVQSLEGALDMARSLARTISGEVPSVSASATPALNAPPRVSGGFAPPAQPHSTRQVPKTGAEASQREPEADLVVEKSKAPLFALLAVVAIVLVGGGAFVALQPAKAAEAPVVAVPAPVEPVVAKPSVEPAPVVKEAPRPAEPVVEKFKLSLTSVPEHVEVYEGDVLLGQTPFEFARASGSVAELNFQLKGFKKLERKFGFVAEQKIEIQLEPLKAAGPKKPAPGLADDPYGTPTPDLKDAPF